MSRAALTNRSLPRGTHWSRSANPIACECILLRAAAMLPDEITAVHRREMRRCWISGSTETVTTTSGKRRPRKKTFAELKDEESSLLKERAHLKKEIAALQLTLAQQRSISNYLKRRKLDFHTGSRTNHEANLIEPKEETTNQNQTPEASTCSNVLKQVKCKETPDESHADACSSEQNVFELPDLNMTPDEDCVQEEIVRKS